MFQQKVLYKVVQVWNIKRLDKWWQTFILGRTIPLSAQIQINYILFLCERSLCELGQVTIIFVQ